MSDPVQTAPVSVLGRPARRRSPISLTPLIDVVFILLVFFMLASSFLDWRTIELSGAVAGGGGAEGSFLVEVRTYDLRFAGRPLPLADLTRQILDAQADHPDRPVLVKPIKGVVLQRTVDVVDALVRAGVVNLSLIRDR